MSRVSTLYRLQEIDLESDNLNVRLDEIRSVLDDSSGLDRMKEDRDQTEQALRSAESAASSAEHLVQMQRQKIEATEGKLYGGQVQNPKELQDLQQEAESLKRHLETLEDRYLEAMLSRDDAGHAHETAESSFESFSAEQASVHKALTEERSEIEHRLSDVQNEREATLASVPPDDQATYDRLRSRLGGLAVAVLEEETCSACGLTVSAATRQTIRGGRELVTCSQCRRVLYGG